MLNNWLFAKGANHEIRLMFKENNIADFEEFLTYNRDIILAMRRKKNSVTTPLDKQKIKLILDAIQYYKFTYRNGDKTIAADPTQRILEELKDWKLNGYPRSTAMHTASLARGSANPLGYRSVSVCP